MLSMDCPLRYECQYGPVYKETLVDARINSATALPGYFPPAHPTYVMKPTCCKIFTAERAMDKETT